jgi:uncharacterized protein (DUF983 family)
MKRKCPHCGQKTIPIINRTFMSPPTVLNCPHCGLRYGMASYTMFAMSALSFVGFGIMALFLLPFSEHMDAFILGNAVGIMTIYAIYLFVFPYEKR